MTILLSVPLYLFAGITAMATGNLCRIAVWKVASKNPPPIGWFWTACVFFGSCVLLSGRADPPLTLWLLFESAGFWIWWMSWHKVLERVKD